MESRVFRFTYDASGRPLSLIFDGTAYCYDLNLQGDVVGILDSYGNTVVSYTYNAWGSILSITGSLKDTVGFYNPLRYRGYVYDTETGLYYLQSRYYDPAIGRFINADTFFATGQGMLGNNMFAYCLNNPVNYSDPAGLCAFHLTTKLDNRFSNITMCGCSGGTGSSYYAESGDNGIISDTLEFIFNTDEERVLEAELFTIYRGQPVVRQNWAFTNGRSGSFGIMFLNTEADNINVVKHEWGHFAQLILMGPINYTLSVAIPSVTSDPYDPYYYSNPWERTADWLSGAKWDDCEYREGSLLWGLSQFVLGPVSVPLFYIWGK